MEYERLPIVLKRYNFEEKMRVLQYYSKNIMDLQGIKLVNEQPQPWELETLLLFSTKAIEYQNKDFKDKNINYFINMINCIKDYQHPALSNYVGNIKFADLIMICYGSIQFDLQSYNVYKYYRYNYLFSYQDNTINMPKEFFNKFGISYQTFLELGFNLSIFCSLKINLDPKILKYIVLKYVSATNLLTLSRSEFNSKIDEYSNNISDYLYCIRPSYIFPFIKNDHTIHLPLPHCMTRAITDSLLYRLTDNNDDLRTRFGKNVLEKYLFSIIDESQLFDEVLEEREYKNGKSMSRTSDVMCKKDDSYIFFESKSLVPYAKTRCLDETFIKKEIEKIRDAVIQLTNQIFRDFNNKYNFFESKEQKINFDKCFGLVVLLEESYIRRELIYDSVAIKMKLEKDSIEYKKIVNHIKICNLYDIERFAFTKTNIIFPLTQQLNSSPFDHPFAGYKTNKKLKNLNVIKFKNNLIKSSEKLKDELVLYKIIKN